MIMTEEMAANVPSVMYQAYAYALRIESSVPSKSAECSYRTKELRWQRVKLRF